MAGQMRSEKELLKELVGRSLLGRHVCGTKLPPNVFLNRYAKWFSGVPKRGRSTRGRSQKHANERKRAQMSAKERKRKSAKGRKRGAKGRKRAPKSAKERRKIASNDV